MQLKDDPRFDITLVDKKPHFENTCAFHHILVEPSSAMQNRITHPSYAPKIKFIQDEVVNVSAKSVDLKETDTLAYDYLVYPHPRSSFFLFTSLHIFIICR
jgi:NADH dehydrogenase FAD-containing subunit